MTDDFAAVVLAGGRARRFGGTDKLMLPVGGRSLLDRTLTALAGARPIVVVGPERPVFAPVTWVREDPPGSGPLAGLAAGLAALPGTVELVAVLAADHPHLSPDTLRRLLDAMLRPPRVPGAVLVDQQDMPQWLVGVWRADVLRHEMPREVENRPVRAFFAPLGPRTVTATRTESSDVDTPDDYRSVGERG